MILTLGEQQNKFNRSIRIKAVFDDVNGLQKGNNVWFSGVKIGTVKKISFFGDSQVEVDMNINQDIKDHIHKDAKAKISTDGLIGNRIVVIYDGTSAAGSIEEDDILFVDKPKGTEQMMSTLQENNENLKTITDDFKIVTERLREGTGVLGKLSADPEMAQGLETTLNSIKATGENIQRISRDLANWSAGLSRDGSLANALVKDTIIYSRLKSGVTEIEELSRTANEAISKINSGLNEENSAAHVLLHDEKSGEDLKKSLENLRTSSEKLDENLKALQSNFLFRRYFKEKSKGGEQK